MKKWVGLLFLILFILGTGGFFFYSHWRQGFEVPTPEGAQYFIRNTRCDERSDQGQRLGKMAATPEAEESIKEFLQNLKPYVNYELQGIGAGSSPNMIQIENGEESYFVHIVQAPKDSPSYYCVIDHVWGQEEERWLCQAENDEEIQKMEEFIIEYDEPIQWFFSGY